MVYLNGIYYDTIVLYFQYYKGFEIPTELSYLWKYLSQVYKTKAFGESCPSDREIIMHYEKKAVKTTSTSIKITLMKDRRTESVPSNDDLNGDNESDEEYNTPHAQVDSQGGLHFNDSAGGDYQHDEQLVNDE